MKAIQLPSTSFLTSSQFCLLATGSGLLAIHLTLSYRSGNSSSFALSLLFWLAVTSSVWNQRHRLKLKSGFFPSFLGLLMIAILLIRSLTLPTPSFLGVFPFLSFLALGLLASGFKGLNQYWRELTVLFFLRLPEVFLEPIIDISFLSAKFATLILWYAGFDVYRQGTEVLLPNGGVNVTISCSGFGAILHLLGLAVLFLVMFPLEGLKKKIIVPLVAISIAFIVNGFRVVLLAIFANAHNQKALNLWHTGEGSLVFSLISVILFGLFCYFLLQLESREVSKTEQGKKSLLEKIPFCDQKKQYKSLLNQMNKG
ncbi:MAG: cyanoexosortase A [Cyanobacteria bacterium P01_G01_bin.49]